MSKERRKLEAVSKGAVNLLDSTAAEGCGHDKTNDGAAPLSAVSAALGQTEAKEECCGSDETKEAHDKTNDGAAPLSAVSAALGQTEAKEECCGSDETKEAHDKTNDGAAPLSAVSAALSQTESAQECCGSDEAKEAEGVVSGFVPNPTVMLVRLATSGVVVPVIQVRAYLFRRGMKVQVYRAFDGWRLK